MPKSTKNNLFRIFKHILYHQITTPAMSKTPKITRENLHIDNPCHENWDQMSPSEQGRFCHVCQTEVVDFVSMSDQQVIDFFANYKGQKLCARLEIPTPKTNPPSFQPSLWRKTAAASLLLLTSLTQCHRPEALAITEARTTSDSLPPIQDRTLAKGPARQGDSPKKLLETNGISGIILKNGKPIAYANVSLIYNDNTVANFQTKADGRFNLKYNGLPANTESLLVIKASHMEFETTSTTLHTKIITPQPLKIELGAPTHRKGKIKVQD